MPVVLKVTLTRQNFLNPWCWKFVCHLISSCLSVFVMYLITLSLHFTIWLIMIIIHLLQCAAQDQTLERSCYSCEVKFKACMCISIEVTCYYKFRKRNKKFKQLLKFKNTVKERKGGRTVYINKDEVSTSSIHGSYEASKRQHLLVMWD